MVKLAAIGVAASCRSRDIDAAIVVSELRYGHYAVVASLRIAPPLLSKRLSLRRCGRPLITIHNAMQKYMATKNRTQD